MNAHFFKIILTILMVLSSPVLAQKPTLKFQHLSLEEGLSQSTVYTILQDSKGFMWFGTQDGLNKYDGYQFTIYRHDPQDANSLSHNEVFSLYEDRTGTLWIGTNNGLNQFDRQRDQFIHYFHDRQNPNSLSHNTVWSIYEDNAGMLWVGTNGGGLNQFDRQQNQFVSFQHDPKNPHSLSHNSVWPFYQDKKGILWIGTDGGGLNEFDRLKNQFRHYLPNALDIDSLSNFITSIYEDGGGTLWIGTTNGLHQFDRQLRTFIHYFHDPKNPNSLSHRSVWAIFEDNLGHLWVATDGGGLNLFDRQTKTFVHYQHDPQNPNSLNGDAILSLYQDRAGTMWVGTGGGGVNYFNPQPEKFAHYFHDSHNADTLSNNYVLSIHEDRQGILWVGTQGSGLNRFDPKRQNVTHYQHDLQNPNSLTHNDVSSIYEDSFGALWIGTYGGGLSKFNRTQNKFISFQHHADNPNSLNSNYVLSIFEDSTKTLWFGTREGLDQFNRQTNQFVHHIHDPNNPNSLSHNTVAFIYEDTKGVLWVGTYGGGLNQFDRQQNSFVRYQHHKNDPTSLSHNEIAAICEDNTGTLWIGTLGGGLNKFDRVTGRFHAYREKDGLANDMIYGILADNQGYLCLSSNKGISKFNPKTEQFRNYDVLDGLQSNEFNAVAHKNQRGELFFGGINGFNVFYPARVKDNPYIPPIVVTDFKIFTKSVRFGKNSPLQQHIGETDEMTLSYKQSFFSFEFAALNFIQSSKNQYAYQLEGLDSDWNEIGSRHHAYYTNVPHGDYIFRVRGSNNDNIWNKQGAAIKMTILPPPWKTWWAYTLYVLSILVIIVYYIWTQKQKLREKQQELEHEKAIAAQLKEADRLKDEFLANTSHELRTPLNGIIGIAESLIDGATGILGKATHTNLGMIASSGRRLLNLVNDILDFSKLKKKDFDLRLKAVDMRTIAEVVLSLSQALVGHKKVQLVNAIDSNLPPINADENRIQQILYNLVGNAIKFTDSGTITVSSEVIMDTVPHENQASESFLMPNAQLAITVSDTGIGIPAEKLDRIFEAFEQADGSTARIYGGTGLGLAVTQQLVNLHGGQMRVQSQVGVGSHFSFMLPISEDKVEEANPSSQLSVSPKSSVLETSTVELNSALTESDVQAKVIDEPVSSKPVSSKLEGEFNILIVDDDMVNRQVLLNHLSLEKSYCLNQAASGLEALELFEQGYQPNLIILDVMMPYLSGYEVTKKIRETKTADELPIILLTAKNQITDLVTGLESGANDYLTKPVSKDELLARIKTHLNLLQLKKARLEAEKKYRDIFENAIEGIFQCTPTDRYLSVNPAFVRMFGYESAEQIYTEITDIGQQLYVDPQQRIEFINLLETHSKVENFEYQARRQDGTVIWVKETVRMVHDTQGKIHYYEGIVENITQRKQAEEKLRYDATHDQLTQLFNRAAFSTYLTVALEKISNECGENEVAQFSMNLAKTKLPNSQLTIPFAVLFVDLDRFKIVNDSMGHFVGDQLLTEVAKRLNHVVSENDLVARFGGDEFALMLGNISDLRNLEQRVDSIQKYLSRAYQLKNETFNTTASIGIALSNSKYNNADEVLRDADTAMYEAKKQGGNKSVIFQPGMHTHVINMLRMERDLRKALEREEFCIYYQPIISLETFKTVGLEALVRWQHPEQGLISPDLFIPLAEETGLIKDLGLWVFETACIQLRNWQTQFTHHAQLGMNINVSPVQLKQPHLVRNINDIITKTGIEAPTCRVEITEGAMMQNPQTALTILNDLKSLNVLLYIDDFGTGYSSLGYLQQFPIDALKIDKSFIQKIDDSDQSAQIVNAIIALGKAFDLRIVAEGVENDLQIKRLKAAHCHHLQGYFFSRPKDAQSIEKFLKVETYVY